MTRGQLYQKLGVPVFEDNQLTRFIVRHFEGLNLEKYFASLMDNQVPVLEDVHALICEEHIDTFDARHHDIPNNCTLTQVFALKSDVYEFQGLYAYGILISREQAYLLAEDVLQSDDYSEFDIACVFNDPSYIANKNSLIPIYGDYMLGIINPFLKDRPNILKPR